MQNIIWLNPNRLEIGDFLWLCRYSWCVIVIDEGVISNAPAHKEKGRKENQEVNGFHIEIDFGARQLITYHKWRRDFFLLQGKKRRRSITSARLFNEAKRRNIKPDW
jgi:hypothetical protein